MTRNPKQTAAPNFNARKILGKTLQVIGWCCIGGFGVGGGMYLATYLATYIGTSGREAGGSVALLLTLTVVGVIGGFVLKTVGGWLAYTPDETQFEA